MSVGNKISALTGATHVCCADQTRVVRTNDVAELYWTLQVGHGKPNEAFLPVAPEHVGVAVLSIPRSWRDDLIIANFAFADADPVTQGSACCVDDAESPCLVRDLGGPDHGRLVHLCPQLGN